MSTTVKSTKICPKCNIGKELSEFYARRPSGYSTDCKSCIRERQRKYHATHESKPVDRAKTKEIYYKRKATKIIDLTIKTKICNVCKIQKDVIDFYKKTMSKDGYDTRCKLCSSSYHKNYNKKTGFRNKYREKNKEKARIAIREWGKKNKEKVYQYKKDKMATDINFKLAINLRHRLYSALINHYKSGSAVKDLGCSIEKFKLWLEMKFQYGMNWDNYGGGWHIDHIIPLSNFNLSNRDEFLQAVHFSNLQPLWAEENLIKSNKI